MASSSPVRKKSPIRRWKPLQRKTGMRRGRVKAWNSTLGNVSPKRKAYLRDSKYSERSKAAQGKPCAVRSPVCTGVAQGLHHILSRGAAGGLEAAERLGPKPIPACNACNEYVEGKGRAWAKKRGLRMTLKDVAA